VLDLLEWLIGNVGYGEQPKVRRKLFEKLVRLVALHGDIVKRTILEAWSYAKATADQKPRDHLFARTVKRKLIDQRLYHEPKPYDHLSGQDLDRAFVDESPLPLYPDNGQGKQTKGGEPEEMTRADFVHVIAEKIRKGI